MVRGVALAISLLIFSCAAAQDAKQNQPPRSIPHEAVFTRYSPLFGNAEILRRLLTPLAQEDVRDTLAHTGKTLSPYPIDLSKEKFFVNHRSREQRPRGALPSSYSSLLTTMPTSPSSGRLSWIVTDPSSSLQ